jgi:rubrerythrin
MPERQSKGEIMSDRALEALKGAILLEKRGQVLYGRIAEETGSEAVREVFTKMREEEMKHEQVLARHYSSLVKKGELAVISQLGDIDDHTDQIMTDSLLNDIDAAGYEASAISAAIALEREAENYYSRKTGEAESETEKKLYSWLAAFEHSHQELLAQMDRVLMEKVWFDNHFWPEI